MEVAKGRSPTSKEGGGVTGSGESSKPSSTSSSKIAERSCSRVDMMQPAKDKKLY
jgi:hypothetical protein